MRAAPPVQLMVVAPSKIERGVAVGVWLLSGACLAMSWLSLPSPHRLVWFFGACAWVLAGVGACVAMRRELLSLRWDGQQWHWGAARLRGNEPCAGRIDVAVDVDFGMLLRLCPEHSATRWANRRQAHWLWVSRKALPGAWLPLRRALYSSRMVPTQVPDLLSSPPNERT